MCSAVARIARPLLLEPIAAENRHRRVHNSPSSRAMIEIEPRCAKSYPSVLAVRVLPLNRTRKNQECKNSFGTLEDLSQDLKIVSLGTLSGPFGTLRDFFLAHYWTFYCKDLPCKTVQCTPSWWLHRATGVTFLGTSLGGTILIENIDPAYPLSSPYSPSSLGCVARRCAQTPPPLLAPFLHVYPSHTTLCCWKVVWGQLPHVYGPSGG